MEWNRTFSQQLHNYFFATFFTYFTIIRFFREIILELSFFTGLKKYQVRLMKNTTLGECF